MNIEQEQKRIGKDFVMKAEVYGLLMAVIPLTVVDVKELKPPALTRG